MSETLRDLVVSLSLNSDNFTRNIKSINKQIQEAESRFKLTAAGVENFESTTTGLTTRLDSLQRRLKLQQDAVYTVIFRQFLQHFFQLLLSNIFIQQFHDRLHTDCLACLFLSFYIGNGSRVISSKDNRKTWYSFSTVDEISDFLSH